MVRWIPASLLGFAAVGLMAACTPPGQPPDPLVLAFYYPWYRSPEFSGTWDHWDGAGHDPDTFVEPGRRDIASTDYPVLGAYDSLDPEIIRAHIAWSEQAGLDGWIVSWWGQPSRGEDPVSAILDVVEAEGADLRISIYYETIPGCSDYFCPGVSFEEKRDAAIEDLNYVLDHYGSRPGFLRVNGEPVVFVYIRPISQAWLIWPSVIHTIKAEWTMFISGDCTVTFAPFLVRAAFDQIHHYNPAFQLDVFGCPSLDYGRIVSYAHRHGMSSALTVIPGYDDSHIDRPYPIVIERGDGSLYHWLWGDALEAGPDWVLVASFNEWHEGTEIEPSLEYGETYLDLTAEYAEIFRGRPAR